MKTMPPAAVTARFNADLVVFTPEAIETQRTFFEPKPGKPDQLVALQTEPAQVATLAVFLNADASPATGARLRNSIAIA